MRDVKADSNALPKTARQTFIQKSDSSQITK